MQTRDYDAELEELKEVCRSQGQNSIIESNLSVEDTAAVKFMWVTSDGKLLQGETDANS